MSTQISIARWLSGSRMVVAVQVGLCLCWARTGQAAGTRLLGGNMPAVVTRLQPVASLPGSNRLNLAISLPLRDREGLANLLQQLYDPASPIYHHFLTSGQFTERFGPTEEDYQKVIAFAARQGLRVTATHPNRLLLDVSGSAADIEKAFQIRMRVYQHPKEARTFFAPDAAPSVDADVPVLEISGLDNYLTPHPASLHPRAVGGGPTPGAGSGSGGTYLANDLRAAYLPNVSLDGTGQTVALFELDGYYANDITRYEQTNQLSSVPLTNVVVSLNGYNGLPDNDANAVAETSLDIEMAIALAPGLSKVMVYEDSVADVEANGITPINDLFNRMATDNQAKQISCSWGWGGGMNITGDIIFLQFAAQGQSFFAASGDDGAYTGWVPEPADDPYITIVGGTTLTTTGPGGSWVSEAVWSWFPGEADASSGGVSTLYSIPSWQQGVSMAANHGSTSMRNIPDVALIANNVFAIYDNGSLGDFAGTSCAAPLWAAFTALVNQHGAAHGRSPVGFVNPAVYAIGTNAGYTSNFHDITTGNNTNLSSPNNYFAVAGYDLCTGWGTPHGSNMIVALLPGLSPLAPTLSWTAPASVVYGTALGAGQLNATANVAGSFAYTPAAGAVLNAGTSVLSALFTPNDTFDYTAATGSASLVVTPAPLNVTAGNATRVYGQGNPAFTASYSGFVNGDGVSALTGRPSLSTTATASSSVAGSPYPIVPAKGTLGANNYSFNFNNGQLTITPAGTANAVASSASASVAGSNVTFTATITAVSPGGGTPTGTVQFYADGAPVGSPANLAGGVANLVTSSLSPGAHAISAQYAGDGNFNGSTGSLSASLSVLSAPVASNVVLQRSASSGAQITVAALLANDTNSNSGALSLLAAGPASTNGGTVVVGNNWVFYTPPSGATNADAFPYAIADSLGAQAAGTVSVAVPADLSQSQNIVSTITADDGASAIQFQGIPGYTYTIQYSPSLATPVWQTVGTGTAGPTGVFEFTSSSPAGYFRSTYP